MMNNIEILEMQLKKIKDFCKDNNKQYYSEELPYYMFWNGKQAEIVENLIKEYKELEEKINKSIEFINDDDTFFCDGESWQNVLHIERILKGE